MVLALLPLRAHGRRRTGTTIYLYERAWVQASIAIPVGMLAALTVTAFGAGIHLPSVARCQDAAHDAWPADVVTGS